MKKTHKLIGFLSTAAIMGGMVSPLLLDAAEFTAFVENTAAQKQIQDLSMYQLILSKESLPDYGSTSVGSTGWYDYANTMSIRNGFSGAIWYMQTENTAGNTEWALIDAPNYSGTDANSIYKLGIARSGNANDVVNMAVTGTNFYTSYDTALMPIFNGVTADADGVKAIQNSTLLIESWPFNFGSGTKGSVLDQDGNTVTLNGGSGSDYDWNDTPQTGGDHGSFQLHIYDAANSTGQTVIGMGRMYRQNETFCVGIGNSNSGNSKDWTMANPTSVSGSRVFQALVKPNYIATDRIFNAASTGSNWTSADAWLGADGNTASTPTTDNDVFINYGNLVISSTVSANMMDISSLGSVTVTENGNLSVPGVKYKDGTETNPRISGNFTSSGTVFIQDHIQVYDNASVNFLGGTFSTNGELRLAHDAANTVTANFENTNVTKANISVGHYGTASMTASNSAFNGTLYVGNAGSGTLDFHNSTLNGNVAIANNDNSIGTMTVTGADTMITSSNFNVGYKGNGTLNFYDGTIKTTDYFCIGNNQSYAEGTVNQYGGLIESVWVPLGHYGKGTWNMYGGKLLATNTGAMDSANSTNHGLQIGDRATSNITFNLYDGTVESKGQMHVGRVGKGVLNQSGGQVVTGSNLIFGHIAGGDGTWNMTGGTANIGALLTIGYRGTGTATISGDAQVATKDVIYVGYDNTGSLTISDNASITSNGKSVVIAENNTGTLTMTGGKLSNHQDLIIAQRNGSKGYAYISGDAQIQTNSYIYVGTFSGSEGLMDISGNADIKVNGQFRIGHQAGSVGTVNIGGNAKVTVGNTFYVSKDSTGTLNQTGGSITARTLAVGDNGTGTYNIYGGSVSTQEWLLAGFNNGTGVINQYGGNVNANWLTLGWEVAASNGTYNMYGGTLTANGVGNPAIIARSGVGTFNLYDGDVTLKTATSTNQGDANKDKFVGYSLKIGAYDGAVAQMNIHAADISAGGKVSMNAKSELNFETSVKGLGTLTVEGAFEQNGGKVSVAHNDAISFTDDYSLENGKDIMTVGGKTAVTVTNDSANILETAYDTATGKLNVQFKDDANRGSIGGNSELSFAPTMAGWVELEDFNTSNPFILELLLDTNGMEIDAFVDILNAELNPSEEELWVVAEASGLNSVKMEFAPNELVGMDVLSWDFSSTDLYGANGVAVIGLDGNEVPEPTTWVLLALGCGLLAWTRNRKKA